MVTAKTPKLSTRNSKIKKEKDQTIEHAEKLYKHVKGKATDLYEHSVYEAQDHIKEHTDNLIQHVQEKPLSSLLIAGGIGFILSTLFRK
ncbi:MAG: hypothetical protein H0T84_05880 [Tatlockia sp.]|nr:hypothetical protein [Tatlockia sp.]